MSRFRYHASAVGASGTLKAPYARLIPAQASAALPDSGGVAHNVSGSSTANAFSASMRSAPNWSDATTRKMAGARHWSRFR